MRGAGMRACIKGRMARRIVFLGALVASLRAARQSSRRSMVVTESKRDVTEKEGMNVRFRREDGGGGR